MTFFRGMFPTRRAAAVLSICLAFPAVGAQAAKKKKASVLQDPTRAFDFEFTAGEPVDALQAYVEFVRKTAPGLDGLRAQYMAADILMSRGEVDAAAAILQQLAAASLSDEFFNESVLQKLGDAYMRLGKYKEAAKAYDDVSQGTIKALVPEATLGKAAAALALGDANKAYLHYQELTAFYPSYRNHPRLQVSLGMILWEMGKYAEALEFFKKEPKNPAALYYTGLCQRALAKSSDAVASFRKVFQENPGTVWAERATFEMGETFYQQRDFPLAARTFSEFSKDHPAGMWHTLAFYRLACTDFEMNHFPEAEEKLDVLYKEAGNKLLQANIIYLLSESLAEQNKIAPIVKILKEQTKGGMASGEANFRLVWALAALGRDEEAVPLANDFLNADWDPELTPKTLLVQGWAYEKSGHVPEAIATYQLVVEHFPDTPHAANSLELMAMDYYRTQQYTPVVTQVRHLWNTLSPELRKKYPDTLFWIAEVHLALKNSGDAARFYREFTDAAKPDNPLIVNAFQGMAVAAAQNRDFTQAAAHLQRAVQAATDTGNKALLPRLNLDLANTYFNGKSYENAAAAYRQFQKTDPQNPQVPFAMFQEGLSLYRAEYYSDAVTAWDKMVKTYPKDPKTPDALMRLAKTHFDMGKFPEAVADYQNFLKEYPKDPQAKDAQLQIGQSYYNAGNYAMAIDAYTAFLKEYPKDEQAAQVTQLLQTCYYQAKMSPEEIEKRTAGQAKSGVLAEIYWEEAAKLYNEKQYEKALADFQKILYEFPSASVAPQASFYRAESLFLMEKYADAVPAFENFVQYYPDDPSKSQAMFHLAVSFFNQKDYVKAGSAFRAFANQFPEDPLAKSAMLNAGVCFVKAGDADNAVEAYLKYAATFPDSEDLGSVYLQLGDFLEKANQLDKAVDAYRRIPANRPEYAQGIYQAADVRKKQNDPDGQRQAYEDLRKTAAKKDPYRIAGLLQLAEMDVAKSDLKGAKALYEDVAANAQDEQSVALAKEQLKVLQSGSPQ